MFWPQAVLSTVPPFRGIMSRGVPMTERGMQSGRAPDHAGTRGRKLHVTTARATEAQQNKKCDNMSIESNALPVEGNRF